MKNETDFWNYIETVSRADKKSENFDFESEEVFDCFSNRGLINNFSNFCLVSGICLAKFENLRIEKSQVPESIAEPSKAAKQDTADSAYS